MIIYNIFIQLLSAMAFSDCSSFKVFYSSVFYCSSNFDKQMNLKTLHDLVASI